MVHWHWLWDRGQLAVELGPALTTKLAEYVYYPGADRPLAIIKGSVKDRGQVVGSLQAAVRVSYPSGLRLVV